MSIMNIEVSEHAYNRMKERMGVKGKKVERYAMLAYSRGLKVNNMGHKFTPYFEKHSSVSNRQVLIYNMNYFIFQGNTLVTMFPIEQEIKKQYLRHSEKSNNANMAI